MIKKTSKVVSVIWHFNNLVDKSLNIFLEKIEGLLFVNVSIENWGKCHVTKNVNNKRHFSKSKLWKAFFFVSGTISLYTQ